MTQLVEFKNKLKCRNFIPPHSRQLTAGVLRETKEIFKPEWAIETSDLESNEKAVFMKSWFQFSTILN